MKRYIAILIVIWGGVFGNWTKASAGAFQENENIDYQTYSGEILSGSESIYSSESLGATDLRASNPTGPGSAPDTFRDPFSAEPPVTHAYTVLILASLLYGLYKRKKRGDNGTMG